MPRREVKAEITVPNYTLICETPTAVMSITKLPPHVIPVDRMVHLVHKETGEATFIRLDINAAQKVCDTLNSWIKAADASKRTK